MVQTSPRIQWLLLPAALLAFQGCAVLAPISPLVPPGEPRAAARLEDGYHEVTGVIHVHTVYSDGTGTVEDIARVANRERLDYVIVTDHNTLGALREGKEGWHGRTLILVGTEVSASGGHYLALGVHQVIDRHRPTQEIIDEVNRQGGFGVLAHPFYTKYPWTDWTVHGFTGLEIYNTAHDLADYNRLRLFFGGLGQPLDQLCASFLRRPNEALTIWDQLMRHRQVVGIGATDAHGVRVFGIPIAPYTLAFKVVRTHVLLPRGITLSAASLYDALRRGHAYVAIDLLSDATGGTLVVEDAGRVVGVMGDEIPLTPALQLAASLPESAELTLWQDGHPVAMTTGRMWRMPITAPGVYRLEASRAGKPWIFFNPIYVRSSTGKGG